MKRFFSLVASEIRATLKSRSMTIPLILIPIVMNIIFGAIFLPVRAAKKIPFAVWDQAGTKESRELIRHIGSNNAFDIRYFLTDQEEGKKLLIQRKIRGFLIIPNDFSRMIKKGRQADITVYEDFTFLLPGRTLMKNLYKIESWYQNRSLADSFRERGVMASGSRFLANPATINFKPLFNPSLEYTQFILPGVLLAVLFQILTLAGATSFFLNRNLYKDRSKYLFLGVKSLSLLILSMISYLLTYGIFFRLFHLKQGDPFAMTALFFLFSLACIWMGMACAALAREAILGMSLIIIFGAIGFTFSGYTWPRFLFIPLFQKLACILPLCSFLEEGSKIFFETGFPVTPWPLVAVGSAYLFLTLILFRDRDLKDRP